MAFSIGKYEAARKVALEALRVAAATDNDIAAALRTIQADSTYYHTPQGQQVAAALVKAHNLSGNMRQLAAKRTARFEEFDESLDTAWNVLQGKE